MRFGYNTNGFAHHRLSDALTILAELGYESVAITLDHGALNPFEKNLSRQVAAVRKQLDALKLRCVVETGARFLLDPWRKHQPTLLSTAEVERVRRREFLERAIDTASELGADAVSFWSGSVGSTEPHALLMARLANECRRLCDYAKDRGVRLAFEPEPGMFIDTMSQYDELSRQVNHEWFGLTLDLGHLHCLGETPITRQVREWSRVLRNIHIEDMRRGVHEHLLFGEGEIEFGPILRTLEEIGYPGGVHVELSRHSHDAVETARRALAFLRATR